MDTHHHHIDGSEYKYYNDDCPCDNHLFYTIFNDHGPACSIDHNATVTPGIRAHAQHILDNLDDYVDPRAVTDY